MKSRSTCALLLVLSGATQCDSAAAFVPTTTPTTSLASSIVKAQPATVAFYANDNAPFDNTQTTTMSPQPVLLKTTDLHRKRKDWLDRSIAYYSKVMREERRRRIGQAKGYDTQQYQDNFTLLAKKHYFALRKIKDGKPRHAETIYRRIINELVTDDEHCDHARLAVTTLLLALLLQRTGNAKQTRSVFLHFFRVAVLDNEDGECACSAKVLQAYALFEMKQGNPIKSLEIVQKAVKLDNSLEPVLNWKQFRDALARKSTSAIRP